uniref:Uncharacterized protein n=1 Tax=Arundo donax TaxID=35708 RepID=A0A0A8YN31_ARUDO
MCPMGLFDLCTAPIHDMISRRLVETCSFFLGLFNILNPSLD